MTDQEGAAMTPDIVTEARRLLDGSVLWDDDHISNVLADLVAEVERLRGWKASAMTVLAEWDNVHQALGEPGELGQSKAAAALAEVERLREALDQRTDPELRHDPPGDLMVSLDPNGAAARLLGGDR